MSTTDYKKNAAGKCVLCWGNGQVINAQSRTAVCPACGGAYKDKGIRYTK